MLESLLAPFHVGITIGKDMETKLMLSLLCLFVLLDAPGMFKIPPDVAEAQLAADAQARHVAVLGGRPQRSFVFTRKASSQNSPNCFRHSMYIALYCNVLPMRSLHNVAVFMCPVLWSV